MRFHVESGRQGSRSDTDEKHEIRYEDRFWIRSPDCHCGNSWHGRRLGDGHGGD